MTAAKNVEHFAELVRAYCIWAEAGVAAAEKEAHTAMRHLVGLLAGALELPELFGDEQAKDVEKAEWTKVFKRFGSLPFNYYSKMFNALPVPPEEPVVGDL